MGQHPAKPPGVPVPVVSQQDTVAIGLLGEVFNQFGKHLVEIERERASAQKEEAREQAKTQSKVIWILGLVLVPTTFTACILAFMGKWPEAQGLMTIVTSLVGGAGLMSMAGKKEEK